ncbi:MAG: DUF2489 domain-containing protein [Agarilytica sp.]
MNNTKNRIAHIAQSMVDGSMNYLLGAIELSSLREEIGAYENDPDFVVFNAVLCEIHNLPFDTAEKGWLNKALLNDEPQINESIEWAKEISMEQCQSLAKRYS